ncbi:MAG: hypothetical protein WC933_00495 [Candidatus Paceibacterota bacterium]|jgi:hypothetical protein
MEQDEKDLLKKTYELSKDNNHILKGIRSANRWAGFFKFLTWVIIIVASLAAYYFVQPYVNTLIKTYQNIQNELSGVKSIIDSIPKTK